jgi:hypothetical protein
MVQDRYLEKNTMVLGSEGAQKAVFYDLGALDAPLR